MAVRKTINFLPEIFRTDANEKFLNATLDQLTSQLREEKINGYIGRKFAPQYKTSDAYIGEVTQTRQNYQLEPGVVYQSLSRFADDDSHRGRIEFVQSYVDAVNRISFFGGNTENHDRLYANEYYNWSSFFDYDKFVNFSQYYWLPNGPDSVQVFTSVVDTEFTYDVSRSEDQDVYFFSTKNNVDNPRIILARGGSYSFIVDQNGFNFWIQTEPGIDGIKDVQQNISTREVFGVDNNGEDVGVITFNVPEKDAQNFYLTMTKTADVDYATRLAYKDVHKRVFSAWLAANPDGIDGITEKSELEGSRIVFFNEEENQPESDWEQGGLFDADGVGFDTEPFDPTNRVPSSERYDIYEFIINEHDIINLARVENIPTQEKVLILKGNEFSNRELWKTASDKLELVPVITAPLDRLYYQDETDPNRFGIIDLVEAETVPVLDIEDDILGEKEYISPNSVEFTNGLKVEFNSDVVPSSYAGKQFYVEGVGIGIKLVDVDELIIPEPFTITEEEGFDTEPFDSTGFAGSSNAPVEQDYFVCNRSSIDKNAWARSNRWFHVDVIEKTAELNNFNPVIDQTQRANRPIVEFTPNLQLFNYGRVFRSSVTLFDTSQNDAFSNVEGTSGFFVDGVSLVNGMTVIWSADTDSEVRNKIYQVSFPDPQEDDSEQIHMVELAEVEENDVIIVSGGLNNQGLAFHWNGTEWVKSQQKTALNQEPLFDVFDIDGNSFSDGEVYFGTSFAGSKLFSYQRGKGTNDKVLGFPLSYKNFENVGDIIFENNYVRDTFTYSNTTTSDIITKQINDGFVYEISDRNTVSRKNEWQKVLTESRQYQIVEYTVNDSEKQQFEVGVVPKQEVNQINLFVYKNSTLLKKTDDYTTLQQDGKYFITLNTPADPGDFIVIRVYSEDINPLGYYEIPKNLENNSINKEFNTLTLGQIRNHVSEISRNAVVFSGNAPGRNNLRDIGVQKQLPGTILQHSAGLPLSMFFLADENVNFNVNDTHKFAHNANYINAITFVQKEYSKFKNKFLDALSTLDLDFSDGPGAVDKIINEITIGKSESFPFFRSDMIGFGANKTETEYIIDNTNIMTFDYGTIFDNTVPSNRSIVVYHNDSQLLLGRDYTFDDITPIIELTSNITLQRDDIIKIVDYNDTNGSYIPPTPTKLGLHPKYTPEKYLDNTYVNPVNVIQGHDGSIMTAFDDVRDDVIIELERRIYNNIKVEYTDLLQIREDIIPGKFRDTGWNITDINSILSYNFLEWTGTNRIDFTQQTGYDITNKFTWNYSEFGDKVDGEILLGHWRGIYRYFYDTDRPHTHPWEMLGLSEKPTWWDDRYGSAPYTKGNMILWEDLRDGKLYSDAEGTEFTVMENRKRSNLIDIIPVDDNGNLVSPLVSIVGSYSSTLTEKSYVFGDFGPIENAWRKSSEYPYALQMLAALTNPAKYFVVNFDTENIIRDEELDQIVDKNTYKRFKLSDIVLHGTEDEDGNINLVNGISQIISEYVRHKNRSLASVQNTIRTLTLNLLYRVGGFTDKTFLKVLAEQVSPTSISKGIFIPDDDYEIELTKSTPIDSISYSGVIIVKTTNGWKITGYDTVKPYFRIIPSIENGNNYAVSAGPATGIVYRDFREEILQVPYETEFTNRQDVFDFLISYQRYLISQGFVFDEVFEDQAIKKDWIMSGREFLFWSSQGWNVNSVITLNPTPDKIKFSRFGSTPDVLSQDSYNYRVLNENFKPIRYSQLKVKRVDNETEIIPSNTAGSIYFIEISPVQYEHTIIFKNTTVFNDVLYQPELGNRQFRLRLTGFRTADWDGTYHAPGYIYNDEITHVWEPFKDYKKGEFVIFRKKTYVCIKDQDAMETFDFQFWKEADNIKTGLLPNLDTRVSQFEKFYDIDSVNNESETDRFGKGLIGYKKRDYLENLGLDDVSQVKFYQGMIREKGTNNVINKLVRARLDNTDSEINVFEEWGFRVGEYGAIDSNQIIEFELDENKFISNPTLIEFLNQNDSRPSHINYKQGDLYKVPNNYDKNIFTNRSSSTDRRRDITYAGFPRLDDIDATLFDVENISTLNDKIDEVGIGYTIWVASNRAKLWDVYRCNETFNTVVGVQSNLDQEALITTTSNHNLTINEFVAIRNVDEQVNGFYRVKQIISNVSFLVDVNTELDLDEDAEYTGVFYKLESVKYSQPSDIANKNPLLGWRDDDLIWVENNENSKWEVRKKNSPWSKATKFTSTNVGAADNLGSSVSSSLRNLWAVAGVPNDSLGKVITFITTSGGSLSENSILDPTGITNVDDFGTSVSAGDTRYFAVGAPASDGSKGYVFVYRKDDASTFSIHQILHPSDLVDNDDFGQDVVMTNDEKWLYIGAPGANKVYCYGLETVASLDEIADTVIGDGVNTTFSLTFTPDDIDYVSVIDENELAYVPNVDYTISGDQITFTTTPTSGLDIVIRRRTGFRHISTITPSDVSAGDRFGSTVSTTKDGRIVVVGAEEQDGLAEDSSSITNTGAAYVYERKVEKFYADGVKTDFTTTENVADISDVYVGTTLQTETANPDIGVGDSSVGFYTKSGNTISFKYVPNNNDLISVEVNTFNLVQKLTNDVLTDSDEYGASVDTDADAVWVVVGAPGEDELNVNTGSVFVYVDQARRYGSIISTGTTITTGHSIRINDINVSFTGPDVATMVSDINNATLPGVIASSSSGKLMITGTSVLEDKKLTVMPGSGTAFTDLGLAPYVQTQKISHPNAFENENFGKVVKIDPDYQGLVVSSDRATTVITTTFDNDTTTFDNDSTVFFGRKTQSGAAYMYDILPANNETVNNPSKFGYVQQLVANDVEFLDEFGAAISYRDGKIFIGSPKDDDIATNAGALYQFNSTGIKGWQVYRSEGDKVDVELINNTFLYNKRLNEIIDYVDWIDPWKGKISGFAEQELSFITQHDPAHYTNNTNIRNTTNARNAWAANQVGKLWWDISTVRYIEYEQGELSYRTSQWGAVFPGSSIDVYEWVESDNLPSLYTGDGTPKHPDNSSYVALQTVNQITGSVRTKYYFWVKNKDTAADLSSRNRSASEVARLIENPKSSGLRYIAFIKSNAVIGYNLVSLLEDTNTIMSINFDVMKNDNVLHSEYQLISEGDPQSIINDKLYNKFVDSLSGANENGDRVPQRGLSVADRYGVLYRPRQTMFVNRRKALEQFVSFCNNVFAQHQVANQFSLRTLQTAEEIPGEKSGKWDVKVASHTELGFINPATKPVGYNVLVMNDETISNLWTIYTKQSDNTWFLTRVQAYDTNNYWDFAPWYAEGFDNNTIVSYSVQRETDLQALDDQTGDLIRIRDRSTVVEKQSDGTYKEVIVDNGTIKLKKSLYDPSIENIGFNNAAFDNNRFDQEPVIEIRKIVEAVKNDIFIEDIRDEWNKLWFVMIEYILSEQPYTDWLFKTSFIKVLHKLRGLDQFPNFQRDNQDFILDYINEVKPYRTNVREYVLQYEKTDEWGGDATDFDVHSYFDTDLGYYRKPSGEHTGDTTLWEQGLNIPWGDNYTFGVGSVIILNGGSGYTEPPKLTVSGGGGSGATLTARTNGDKITSVVVDTAGSGYTTQPSIEIEGTGTGLELYVQLSNTKVRQITTKIKFDRISHSSDVVEWSANTSYTEDQIISHEGEAYIVSEDFTSGDTFDAGSLEIYDDVNFTTAADRIMGFYYPSSGMIGKDLKQLQYGTDYEGEKVFGPDFTANPGFDVGGFDVEPFDGIEFDDDGIPVISGANALDTIFKSSYSDNNLGTRPGDLDVDGGSYVDEYSSHAPEEMIPGIMFDTLDMKVYTGPSTDAEYDGNSFPILSRYHIADGTTSTFAYSDGSLSEDYDNIFVWTENNGLQYEDTDFTVNYTNGTITFTSSPVNGDIIYIYSFGNSGESPISEDIFTADGTTSTFTVNVDPDLANQVLVMVNGDVDVGATASANSDNTNITDVVLSTTPSNGQHVHIYTFNQDTTRVAYSRIETSTTTVPPTPSYTFSLADNVKYAQPFAANIIVEKNGQRLRPNNTVYHIGDGSSATFTLPTSAQDDQTTISPNDIQVAVISREDSSTLTPATNKQSGVDYSPNPFDGSSTRTITFFTPPNKGDIVIVSTTTDAEYTVSSDGTQVVIDSSQVSLSSGDKVRITTFANHDPIRIQTKVFKGSQTPALTYSLDRTVSNSTRLWITWNGTKLHAGSDFSITESGEVKLSGDLGITSSDIITITSFSEEIMIPVVGYRLFKNMLGDVEFYRIASENTTTLTQDLNITDETIYVKDASVLSSPNKESGVPGVIFIKKERITFWEKDNATNTLTNIRRATGGTGAVSVIASGTQVIDSGTNQVVPGSSNNIQTWYDQGTSSATNGNGLLKSDTIQARFLKAKRTVILD